MIYRVENKVQRHLEDGFNLAGFRRQIERRPDQSDDRCDLEPRSGRPPAETAKDFDPIMSSRGPRDGEQSGDNFTRSKTLRLHGPKKEWVGNIVYGDNHTDVAVTFKPDQVGYEMQTDDPNQHAEKDNIFAKEFTDYDTQGMQSGDAWLVLVRFSNTLGTFNLVFNEELD